MLIPSWFWLFMLLFTSVFIENGNCQTAAPAEKMVKLQTSHGDILLKLYHETPLHRDNFVKIVKDGVLDSLLFHRVIQDFMIQGGDTSSKTAKAGEALGSSDLPYTVPAEFHPTLFHKKGALGAARGDTPERESSSTQFYIVQGKLYNDSLLDRSQDRINEWLAEYYVLHDPKYQPQLDSLTTAMDKKDWETASRLGRHFRALAKDYNDFEPYLIPEAHRKVYKTVGGTPFLDQNYTVFGEVVSGLEVVDSIAAIATDSLDRPVRDVRILKATLIEK
jgi:peptidyl-prolyl cis-trans isomerase B (cyclophilin B)